MLGVVLCRILSTVRDTDGIVVLSSAIEHADFIDDGPLNEGVLFHEILDSIHATLEGVIAAFLHWLTIVSIEVEPNVLWAATGDVLALGTSLLHEVGCIVQILCNERGGEVLVPLTLSDGCSLLPVRHDHVDAGGVLPELRQGLLLAAALQGPEASACGVRVLPAIAFTLGVRLRRGLAIQVSCWTVARVDRCLRTGLRALAEHVTHAATVDVRLVASKEDVCHRSGRLDTIPIQEAGLVGFPHIRSIHCSSTPLLWHENEILGQVLWCPVRCFRS
mmetsp:Transcript_72816/g.152048  ORF Transcript_72816/g.152048 Transcript_72816/m.152048 type:complete len:276 (-) Transcript_72816:368-1195(-)